MLLIRSPYQGASNMMGNAQKRPLCIVDNAQADRGLCSLLTESIVYVDKQRMARLDCMDANLDRYLL